MQELVELSGKISVRIAVNTPQKRQPQRDIQLLINAGQSLSVCLSHTACFLSSNELYCGLVLYLCNRN